MRYFLAIMMYLIISPAMAEDVCTCKYKEMNVPEGQTICMQTPNGSRMAKCVKVLNNTSWKFEGATCPSANLHLNQSHANANTAELIQALAAKQG
jgi:hypothetical protein